jgi:hypothetical protein
MQTEESSIRIYMIIITFIAGPVATSIDVASVYLSGWENITLQYGPCARTLMILAIDGVMKIVKRFVLVLPGVLDRIH